MGTIVKSQLIYISSIADCIFVNVVRHLSAYPLVYYIYEYVDVYKFYISAYINVYIYTSICAFIFCMNVFDEHIVVCGVAAV